jgi:predicted transposase YdaD
MPAHHDTGYKLLFSDPLMVRDLLLGFVDDPWLARLDFSTLELVNSHYVSEDLRNRADDVVWRVRADERWVYLYLLIEFQSSVDRFMALRMLVYVGLLYQDLVRRKQLGPDGLLPPVLPIVLYNGERRWKAPVELEALLPKVPVFLAPLQPKMRYLLIDEGAQSADTLARLPRNLVAAIFQLEQPQTLEAVQTIVAEVESATRSPEYATARRLIAIWLRAALRRNRKSPILLPELDDLQELKSMLSQRIEKWAKEFQAEGERKGRAMGVEEGRLEGQARVLDRLLTRRFGDLPAWVRERLGSATEAQLESWTEAVLDAPSLTAIFGEPPSPH